MLIWYLTVICSMYCIMEMHSCISNFLINKFLKKACIFPIVGPAAIPDHKSSPWSDDGGP